MTVRLALIFAATALASANALAQDSGAAPGGSPPPGVKAFIESCSAHKFETTVNAMVDGKPRRSKVKLCGNQGQSDADWARTLEDAARKVAANDSMPAPVKAQITAALTAEIARINAAASSPAGTANRPPAVLAGPSSPPAPLPEYSVLPPLPSAPRIARPAPAPPVEYSALPPLPAGPRAAAARSAAAAQPVLARPRLTITCLNSGDIGRGGECIDLERETLLTVRADEALTAGTSLRFLRRGEARGDIALSAMRIGQSARFRLPRELCAGVSGSRVEIQIVRSAGAVTGQVVGSEGPYSLRC